MIRVLVMIAVAGFLLCVATFTAAIAIGGPEALTHAAWTWGPGHHWVFNEERWDHDGWHSETGPQSSREVAWTGGDTLDVDVPAEIRYTQAPGPAKLTISGSQRAVEDVEVRDGHIGYEHSHNRHWAKLVIVLSAPDITRFNLHGSSSLAIEDYKQPRLRIDLAGNAQVTAKGETDVVELDISGSAEADLGGVKAKGAEVDIAGSGEATIAPTDWAKVDISGSGDVTLLTHPAKLDTDVSGSGSIHQQDGATPTPTPSPSATPSPTPSPSPSPSPKRGRT
jgi:hypothetical protein